MREYSTALEVDVPTGGNLTDDVVVNGTEHPADIVFSRRASTADQRSQGWADVTAEEFLEEVQAVAKGLIAAGIEAGDRVAIISRTRYEWTLLDYAIWFAGAATVPVYETSSPEQIEWILSDSGARAVFTETPEHAARLKGVRERLPDLHHVWHIDGPRRRHRADPRAGRRRRRPRAASYDGRARRPGHADLHLGHDGPAQGMHAHARQLHVRADRGRRGARSPLRRARRG